MAFISPFCQSTKPSREVVVPKADSLVGASLSLDRLDPLLQFHHVYHYLDRESQRFA